MGYRSVGGFLLAQKNRKSLEAKQVQEIARRLISLKNHTLSGKVPDLIRFLLFISQLTEVNKFALVHDIPLLIYLRLTELQSPSCSRTRFWRHSQDFVHLKMVKPRHWNIYQHKPIYTLATNMGKIMQIT